MNQKLPAKKKSGVLADARTLFTWLRNRSRYTVRTIWRMRVWMVLSIATISILFLVVAVFIAGRQGWRTAISTGIVCTVGFQPLLATGNGFVELLLEKQELVEPVFDGGVFINLTQQYGKNPMRLKVNISGVGNYANSTYVTNLNWDEIAQVLWMSGNEKMNFVSQSGSHRNFPFDSATFDFTLKTDPLVNLPVFRFTNRAPGFYMPCETVSVHRSEDGSFKILFELRRDLLTRVAAVVLFLAAVIFAFAITIFSETKTLPTAVASYFFSLWSIRGIFGLGPEGFPTLLDLGILSLCLLILLLLAARLLFHVYQKARTAPTSPIST